MHHLKKFVLYTIMALCAFSLLLFVIPTDKMSPGSRNTPKDLKSYMKFHHNNDAKYNQMFSLKLDSQYY